MTPVEIESKLMGLLFLVNRISLLAIFLLAIRANAVWGQITSDGTLESTVEIRQQLMKINGGIRQGNNLFHSFEQLAIPEGMEASFENTIDIENIFTRVTGDSISNINGILRTQGGANFFLVNPNGIVFGQNASIDVGGSFVATTAEKIQFEDGTELIANQESQPILTVSVPIGLQFENGNSGAIAVDGAGHQIQSDTRFSPIDLRSTEQGLSVSAGKTLALIGGDVTLSGGIISSEGGKIEIGSINLGSVSFQQAEEGLVFGYDNATSHHNIKLAEQTLLNTSGKGSGSISLTGNDISLLNSSFVLIQNTGQSNSRALKIDANESLTLSGTLFNRELSSGIRSESLEGGKAANIDVSTPRLQLRDGAQIISSVYGQASGSDVSINAFNTVEIFGGSISSGTFDLGNAGNVRISTTRLKIMEGGSITSSTIGSGSGGEVAVNADLIDVAGRVSIDRSNIAAVSFGTGNAGSLNINTKQLKVRDQALVNTSSRASGDAGSITIDASELIEVSGTNKNFQSAIRAGVELTNTEARKIFGLPEVPSGNSGNITINSPVLNVIGESLINVSNQGTGDAGTLAIEADEINLDNKGSITATSASGTGGNLELNVDNLRLNNKSTIASSAEDRGEGGNITINASNITAKKNSAISADAEGGNGGNITLDTTTLLGLQNSDITANATGGDGGNINVNSDLILGLVARPQTTVGSDITASSDIGIDGTVEIKPVQNNLQPELEQRLLKLLTTKDAIANSCLARQTRLTSLIVSGNEGFSSRLRANYSDLNSTLTGITVPANTRVGLSSKPESSPSPVPAQKMIQTSDGRIWLVAAPKPAAESLICSPDSASK